MSDVQSRLGQLLPDQGAAQLIHEAARRLCHEKSRLIWRSWFRGMPVSMDRARMLRCSIAAYFAKTRSASAISPPSCILASPSIEG
jgi:hypothetical protein